VITTPTPAEGHVTTAGAPGVRVWRATVIGLVALLAVAIGAALGAYLLGGRGGGMGAGASYVPADAAMYVELRLEPSADQDAAIRELLARFPPIDGVDLDRPLLESLTAHLDELLAAEGVSVSWGQDVAPWSDGRIGFALTGGSFAVPPTSDPMAMPPMPSMLLMLGVTNQEAASAAIERMLAQLDAHPGFAPSEHGGVTVFEAADGLGAYAVTPDQLLYAPSADDIRAALDAHASGDTLARSSDVERYESRLPADWIMFGTYDLSNVMADALAQMGTAAPEMVETFETLLASQPMRAAYAVSATVDGIAMDVLSDAPTGALAPVNGERGLASEVPGDALYFADGSNVGAGLAALVESLKAGLAADPAMAEQIATAEAALGADLEALVSWIGDGAIFVGWDGTMPNAGFVLVPTDVDEARRRLGQIGSFAELAALDPSSGISVGEHDLVSDAAPVTVTTISWQMQLPDGAGGIPTAPVLVLQYAVTADRALVGFGDTFVAELLELNESESLAANPRYASSVEALGGTPNVGTVWMDFDVLQETIESLIPDSGGFYEESVRPWLSPLDSLVSVTRLDGAELETHALLAVE
jgi:Protein of unknown function (DUF3352)